MELTKRELEVLELLILGYQDREIAEKLKISKRTVEGYASRIVLKLHAHNRTDAVANFLRKHYGKY